MSLDFDTLLRQTHSSVPPVNASEVIARADRKRRHRLYAAGAGIAAGLLAASTLGWGVYTRVASNPLPAGPGPVTADCVVSQRHSMPVGKVLTQLRSEPAGTAEVIGRHSSRTTIKVTQAENGQYRLAASPDPTTSRFKNLNVVGGGKCGLTVFADGDYRYVIAPVSPDAERVSITFGVQMITGMLAPDGTPLVVGISPTPDLQRPVTAEWLTTDGSVVNSNADEIRTLSHDGVRVSVNTTRRTANVESGDSFHPMWEKVPMKQPAPTVDTSVVHVVMLLPNGTTNVRYRLFTADHQVSMGPTGSARGASLVPVPGSAWSAFIVRTGSGDAAHAIAQLDWTAPDGSAQRWSSPNLNP